MKRSTLIGCLCLAILSALTVTTVRAMLPTPAGPAPDVACDTCVASALPREDLFWTVDSDGTPYMATAELTLRCRGFYGPTCRFMVWCAVDYTDANGVTTRVYNNAVDAERIDCDTSRDIDAEAEGWFVGGGHYHVVFTVGCGAYSQTFSADWDL